jgi:citrate lyase subunit beta/citryl-CoA lyase
MMGFKQIKNALSLAQAFLFVPGNRPDRFAKSLATHAHAVIIDLEDAVPLSAKEEARQILLRELPDLLKTFPNRIVVRINAHGTDFFTQDLELVNQLGLNAILLPKAESKSQLIDIERRLKRPIWVIPMIESAGGIDQMRDIASHSSVVRLTLGNIDVQANLGMVCGSEEFELLPLRYQMTVMSRLFDLGAPIDGVTVNLKSDDVIKADIDRAKRIGFSAKLCIHPAQVDRVIAGFRPSDAEIEKAKAIVLADGQAHGGAVQLDGKMIDRPVVLMAKLVLQQAGLQ